MDKYCRAGQATDDNMAHAHCMQDTLGYKTDTCVVFVASVQQQWLHERSSTLCYIVHYLSCYSSLEAWFGVEEVNLCSRVH